MARIETWLRCNLQSMVRVQELSGDLFTADNQANRIGVIVTDNNGQPVQLTGGVIGYIIRPDEETVVVNGSISSNRAWIDLPASAYVVKGPISIVIKNGNTTIAACHGYIKRSITDHIVDPGHEIPSLSELLAEIANMRTATSAANTAAGAANSAAGAANTAATNADNKASAANTAAGAANEAATNANGAAGKINNMTVAASGLTAGSAPTVAVSDVSDHKHILFGIPKGDKGDPGKDFRIKRTFTSIAQMEEYDPSQDQSEYKVLEFDYVMIDTGSVSDVDTGKLYCYEPQEQTVWHYIGDLSGAQGIKGETGNGISSVQLNQDYTLTITYTNGSSVTTASIRGAKGDKGDTGNTGAQGPVGATPHLSIGTVTDLPAGSTPTAEFTGTDENPVLNLGLVHGASGNETIDDTAGIGDTDLVYSADKVVKLFRSEHEDLTSGNAEQVIGKVASTEKGAYLYRRGMHLGNRCREKVVGGTVAWNQLVQNGDFANTSGYNSQGGWTATSGSIVLSNKVCTYTVNTLGNYAYDNRLYRSIVTQKGHKYFGSFDIKPAHSKAVRMYLEKTGEGNNYSLSKNVTANVWNKNEFILSPDASTVYGNIRVEFGCKASDGYAVNDTDQIRNIMLIDLTAMFGSTIADAIYAMEQATAGSGVAWFRSLFPKDYYAYDAGSLQSVQASEKKVVGFNQWDEEWEAGIYAPVTGQKQSGTQVRCKNLIPVLPNTNYYFNGTTGCWALFYDASKNLISGYTMSGIEKTAPGEAFNVANNVFATPSNAHYLAFYAHGTYGSAYKNDICINISDPAKNGTYEPYTPHTYPFDTSLTLRGIPKLDSNNRLYYDGDEYESSGKVTRKYGIVDLGTLTWTKTNDPYPTFISDGIVGTVYTSSSLSLANVVCSKYPVILASTQYSDNTDKNISLNSSKQIKIRDTAYSDAATFKTAMSGVYLVYELAMPTTEQASPFTPIMSFNPAGTEEFTEWGTRDVAIPVGHITEYLTDPAKILNNIPLIEVEKESASVVTFSDGAEGLPLKELTVKVEPVQDLHGYENPWPAGGGKNLLPMTVDGIKAVNTDGTWSGNAYTDSGVTFTLNTDNAGNVISIKANGTASGYAVLNFAEPTRKTLDNFGLTIGSSYIFTKGTSNEKIAVLFNGSNANITATESGNTFTATTDDTYYPQIRLVNSSVSNVMIYPILCLASASNPTAFAPYSNICPISGHTQAKVTRTGKNLFDKTKTTATKIIDVSTGGLNTNNGYSTTDYIKVNAGAKLSFTGFNDYYNACYDESKNFVGGLSSRTVPVGASYLRVSLLTTNVDTAQIEIADSATDFEPYAGQEYQITFPSSAGTVYGGTLTVNKDGSGELVVKNGEVDLGTLNYTKYDVTQGTLFRGSISDVKTLSGVAVPNMICSMYPVTDSSRRANKTVSQATGLAAVDVTDNDYSDATTFKTAMSGVHLVYELATPVTYSITPVEVTTLLGINNLWSNTGDIALTYRADLKKYIDSKFAELSAAITALGT